MTSIFCGVIQLSPGTTQLNFTAYLLASFLTFTLFVFINASLGFVLAEIIGIPVKELGYAAGSLTFYDELLSLIMVIKAI
jgi:membrane protein DedA with SNARE-associated domain